MYECEEKSHAHFVDKNIVEYTEVFRHLEKIEPNVNNAFLFSKRIQG